MEVPRFAELPVAAGAPAGSSWGVFGADDELGTLNFVGPDEVRAAAGLVRRGAVFPLNWEVSQPAPPFFHRHPPAHELIVFQNADGGTTADDYLDSFWLQGSSQWDALRHFGDRGRFYNGHVEAEAVGRR